MGERAVGNWGKQPDYMSNLVLGTVQFGVDYGVSNRIGRTYDAEIENILKYADKKDINMLDTAPAYGNSESIIGNFIHNCTNHKQWRVITKTLYSQSDTICDKQVDELLDNLKLSQKNIYQKSIYGLLIHNCDDLFLPGGEKLFQIMKKLKQDGVIKKIGVSVYSSKQIDRVLDNYQIDLVQLPLNILDQRLLNGGQLNRLKEYDVEIHARSVFLQGLLLMPLKSISPWFDPIRRDLDAFHIKAKKLNMSSLQLALGFVRSISEVDKIVVGINTLHQLYEIVNAMSTSINTDDCFDLSISDSTYLNPSNWKI
jgi:aryl-alcohol dehydrogenase-like predicted oxidoreductase